MDAVLQQLMKEHFELLDSQSFDPKNIDYRILDYHLPLLRTIDSVENGCISVFDMYKRSHVYFSPKYQKLLGWDPIKAETDVNYSNSMIHKDDLLNLYRAGINYISLGFSMADKKDSKNYKAIFEYRVIGKTGNYVRVIEQQVPLEFDKAGNVWLALSMLDISPDQDMTIPFRGRLKNNLTGQYFNFPPEEELPKQSDMLTSREKEVLELIARGLISKEIADKLYISVNTVNTHRQRIIEKLNVSNTYEAIRYGHERGLF